MLNPGTPEECPCTLGLQWSSVGPQWPKCRGAQCPAILLRSGGGEALHLPSDLSPPASQGPSPAWSSTMPLREHARAVWVITVQPMPSYQ